MRYTPVPENLDGVIVMRREDYATNRPAWLRERKNSLGASEVAAILGLYPGKTPLQIWLDKTSSEIESDDDMAEAAQWGLDLEHTVAQRFVTRNRELGKLWPTPGLLRHEDHPRVHATLDRLLVNRGGGALIATAGIEVKTTGQFAYKKNWIDGVVPTKTIIQDQIQMAVTGLPRVYNPVLVGGQYMPQPAAYVERDEEIIEHMLRVADEWWEEHIVKGVRPEPILGDLDEMGRLFPEDRGVKRRASSKEIQYVSTVLDAKRRISEAEAEKDEATFLLKDLMREATELEDPAGNTLATWRESKPGRKVDRVAMAKDHPDFVLELSALEEKYMVAKQAARPFNVKEIEE